MRKIVVELEVEEVDFKDDFPRTEQKVRLTHPSLSGVLLLTHGGDPEPFLKAIEIDPDLIDPVDSLVSRILGFFTK